MIYTQNFYHNTTNIEQMFKDETRAKRKKRGTVTFPCKDKMNKVLICIRNHLTSKCAKTLQLNGSPS